ncbi:MAG TPA: hypothetical protein VI298_04175 [Geobacteraceae bacterium]
MRNRAVPFLLLLALLCFAPSAGAGVLKAYFPGVAVTGAQNRDEMRTGLRTLLVSHLTSGGVFAVDTPADADIIVTGDYVEFGKIFSIDAVAKGKDGTFLARAFVQGEGKDELVPAVGKLAKDLVGDVRKGSAPLAGQPASAAP